MKWIGLAAVLACIVPLSAWLRCNPIHAPKVWMGLAFLPFVLTSLHLYVALISWPEGFEHPGFVKGMEVSLVDVVALALYLSLPAKGRSLPFRLSMVLYFLTTLISTLQTQLPASALFYCWQLLRMFLVYAAVARGCADQRTVAALLRGLAAGLCLETSVAIWQRFGLGMVQVHGTEVHQNLIGLNSHFIVFPFFALLIAGNNGRLPLVVVLAGVTLEVLTASRATVGLAVFGYGAVFLLSSLRQFTLRKVVALLTGFAAIAIFLPIAQSSFERRFAVEDQTDYDERAAYKAAAGMMLSDHPFGVGANNYAFISNINGYNFATGVAPTELNQIANVHNVYWLIAAETGYVGLITLVILLLRPLIVAFRCGWGNRKDQRGDLLLGIGIALLTVYIHSFFEWIWVSFQVQYFFSIQVGLVAGLAQQLGYWRLPQRQRVRGKIATLPIKTMPQRAVYRSIIEDSSSSLARKLNNDPL